MTIADAVAATVAGGMVVGASFAAVVLSLTDNVVTFGDRTLAIGAGAFGGFRITHSANI